MHSRLRCRSFQNLVESVAHTTIAKVGVMFVAVTLLLFMRMIRSKVVQKPPVVAIVHTNTDMRSRLVQSCSATRSVRFVGMQPEYGHHWSRLARTCPSSVHSEPTGGIWARVCRYRQHLSRTPFAFGQQRTCSNRTGTDLFGAISSRSLADICRFRMRTWAFRGVGAISTTEG